MTVDSISEDDVRASVAWVEARPSKRRPGKTVAWTTVKNHHGLPSRHA